MVSVIYLIVTKHQYYLGNFYRYAPQYNFITLKYIVLNCASTTPHPTPKHWRTDAAAPGCFVYNLNTSLCKYDNIIIALI